MEETERIIENLLKLERKGVKVKIRRGSKAWKACLAVLVKELLKDG